MAATDSPSTPPPAAPTPVVDESAPSPAGLAATVLLGMVLIAIITPLSMFLSLGVTSLTLETASPVGWAVGLLFAAILALMPFRALAKSRRMSRPHLVILYAMLTVAVPLMNLGLVRQCLLTTRAALHEYMEEGNNTYRLAYKTQKERWFPIIPTREGLAYARSDRLVRFLEDQDLIRERRTNLDVLQRQLARLTRQLAQGEAITFETLSPGMAAEKLASLGPDNLTTINTWLQQGTPEAKAQKAVALQRMGLTDLLAQRTEATRAASEAAKTSLQGRLKDYNELIASAIPANLAQQQLTSRQRIQASLAEIKDASPSVYTTVMKRIEALSAEYSELQTLAMQLSQNHRRDLILSMADTRVVLYEQMTPETFTAARTDFTSRLPREERIALTKLDGTTGPNQNLSAFRYSLWPDQKSIKAKEARSFWQNVGDVWAAIPWQIWLTPILLWSTLFLAIFILFMCLSEWLRRKWVDRENLAFPLVDMADNLIRHDALLETADDIQAPPARPKIINPIFLLGFGVGFIILLFEALGHYELIETQVQLFFDASNTILTKGMLKTFGNGKIQFVLSPIVLGLAFLVSLEVSFSIWASFFLFHTAFWIWSGSATTPIRDSIFSGYGGGRWFPFPMDQFQGATICFTLILMYKMVAARRNQTTSTIPHEEEGETNAFVPPKLWLLGMVLMPLIIVASLWDIGVSSWLLLIVFLGLAFCQSIAEARIRAETGLPLQHSSYEFSKLPIIYGFSHITGKSAYAVFSTVAFLPMTLLFRMLPQNLENIELARRHKLRYRWVAIGTLAAGVTAIIGGFFFALVFHYYKGTDFGYSAYEGNALRNFAHYPLWVVHYFGEDALDSFSQINWLRVAFVGIGFFTFGILTFLRGRFLSFPINPIGYIILLASLWYGSITPYTSGIAGAVKESSFLWGGVFVAWLIKKFIIKYGGMTSYKHAKPFFIGLIIGAVVCLFAMNMIDLGASALLESYQRNELEQMGIYEWIKAFDGKAPYNPLYY